MHVPDGFLDTKTVIATATLSAFGLGVAWQKTRKEIPAQRIPLLGLSAAFVFAAQMLNFPVAGGTSGHLMGAVLTSVLLGPSASIIAITSVLIVQCFLFADGGVLALGANIFNMAIIGSVVGYAAYRVIARMASGDKGQFIAIVIASWISVVLASICCAGELAWSGTVPWSAAFPAMASVHMLIGVGEGVITALVIAAIRKARPDLLTVSVQSSGSYRHFIAFGLVIALGLAVFVSPFASPWPDGLERVAARLGFDQRVLHRAVVSSPFPDYEFPGFGSATTATIVAGVVGVLVVLAFALLLARGLKVRRKANLESSSTG